jgi:hypothetical protein
MDTPPVASSSSARAARAGAFDPRAYRAPRPSPALVYVVGWLNRLVLLPHVVRLERFDLPAPDLARLRAAVQPGTAAFLGPNHAEFTADWLIDKEVSFRVSPLMAHWAAREIVNVSPLAQWLSLRNNLIANVPGGGGRDYSVRWALAGHGVLLHPEGTTSWHGDHVHTLLPGIVDLAWETCRRLAETGRSAPVFIVPLVYRMRFARDVSRGLGRAMALIERHLALPRGDGLAVEERFAALQTRLLRLQQERLALPGTLRAAPPEGAGYFAAQEAVARAIVGELEARGTRVERDMARLMRRTRRAARGRAGRQPAERERDRLLTRELWRLEGFSPAIYDVPFLTQEHIAENLNRTRSMFVTRGLAAVVRNVATVPVGRRVAHVRVAEPIAVHGTFTASDTQAERAKADLLARLRQRLQGTVDALRAELAPLQERWRRPNPLWTGRAG